MNPYAYYVAAACLALVAYRSFTKKSSLKLPPGPPKLPFIGNFFDAVKDTNPSETYARWGKEYNSDIVSFEVLGSVTVVLNSAKAVNELLEKRSSNTSSRPKFAYVKNMMGWGWDLAHQEYSDWWRFHRRVFHQYFNPMALPNYHGLQLRGAVSIVDRLATDPENFSPILRHEVGRGVLKVVYGYESTPEDPLVDLADNAMYHLAAGMLPGILADYFPSLQYYPLWLPGSGFKKFAQTGAAYAQELRDKPFAELKVAMANGTAPASMVTDALARYENLYGEEGTVEEIVKSNAATAFVGAADTTVALSMIWILAMIRNPEIQKKAQAEVDSVVGCDRFADFKDRPHLPYIEAMLSETLRWMPVTPTGGTPHANVEDEFYNGYYIPAGSTLVANTLEIMRDPVAYPNPEEFNPERFLGPNPQQNPHLYAFGSGRRICPGRHFAVDATWAILIHMLSTYDILPALDANGKPIIPPREGTVSAVSYPVTYKCRFVHRSPEVAKLVQNRKEELSGL